MTKRTEIITPNLYVLGQEIQTLVQEGWVLAEGYPEAYMFHYKAVMELDESQENNAIAVLSEDVPVTTTKRSTGRPKKIV